MMKPLLSMLARIALACLMFAALPACNESQPPSPTDEAPSMQSLQITGKLAYRARIALPPDSIAHVHLLDISVADRAAQPIVSNDIALKGKQVPIDFRLEAPADQLMERNRYSVRATINRSDGSLLWTTDTANPVNIKEDTDLGTLMMVQAGEPGRAGKSASSDADKLQSGIWLVRSINQEPAPDSPQLSISFKDGTVSGNAGCNRFTGSYEIKENELTLGTLASTMMACVPGLDQTEQNYLSVINDVRSFRFDESFKLILKTEDERTVIAERAPE